MSTAKPRALLVLLLVCAVLTAQAVSLVSAQSHAHTGDCCGLCHIGPLPLVLAEVSSVFVPVLSDAWLERFSTFNSIHDVQITIDASRAPPA